MGITASIYRAEFYDGRTELNEMRDVEEVTVVNADGPFEPEADAPAVLLRKGHGGRTVRAVPAVKESGVWVEATVAERPIGPMAGGTYIATSDSRFSELVREITGGDFYGAVALHDRYEDQETYDTLSR